MSKVIVVERCGDCPYMKWTGETTACSKTGMEIDPLSPDFDKYEAGAGMPDWCPLQPMPKRCAIDHEHDCDEVNAWRGGWNSCLNQFEEVEV